MANRRRLESSHCVVVTKTYPELTTSHLQLKQVLLTLAFVSSLLSIHCASCKYTDYYFRLSQIHLYADFCSLPFYARTLFLLHSIFLSFSHSSFLSLSLCRFFAPLYLYKSLHLSEYYASNISDAHLLKSVKTQ